VTEPAKRATVLVLGDLGRSPRMLNHARSLASHGWTVTLVGLAGARLPNDLETDSRVIVRRLDDRESERRGSTSGIAALARLARRGVALGIRLIRALPPFVPAQIVLVQNPPGIPTLPVAWLMTRLSASRLVLDWHNLTAAMLRLTWPEGHGLVRFAAAVERWVGRRADVNLFVSAAMAARLDSEWGLRGTVFRDRPGAEFAPIAIAERRQFRTRMLREAGVASDEREAIIVLSPTSWTADEDFDLLAQAIRATDTALNDLPERDRQARLVVLASGRGALRDRFEQMVATSAPRHVAVRTVWFEPGDYARAVASSDVGLCLHRSASGLDLPMKVMDFFGAGVPVLALDYGPCLGEAVTRDVSGLLFVDHESLTSILVDLVTAGPARIALLQPGALDAGRPGWSRAWDERVLPLLH
jgi:beta-1,4-mannosyltransferase